MAMNITVAEAKEALKGLEEFLANKQQKIRMLVADIQKAMKKGDYQAVKSLNNWITRHFEGIKETEIQIEEFQYELKLAEELEAEGEGWNVVVDFLEQMYTDDMVWYKELKALSYEERSKATKVVQMIAGLNEEQAKKLFRQDVTLRFHKLVIAVKNKAGDHIQKFDLERNDNGGLDGFITGEKATVRLETIIAGGYNIQRAHYRTLVK